MPQPCDIIVAPLLGEFTNVRKRQPHNFSSNYQQRCNDIVATWCVCRGVVIVTKRHNYIAPFCIDFRAKVLVEVIFYFNFCISLFADDPYYNVQLGSTYAVKAVSLTHSKFYRFVLIPAKKLNLIQDIIFKILCKWLVMRFSEIWYIYFMLLSRQAYKLCNRSIWNWLIKRQKIGFHRNKLKHCSHSSSLYANIIP